MCIHTKILAILKGAVTPSATIRATELYCEGWMLRLALDWAQAHAGEEHPFFFQETARWFSEALLPTQFQHRSKGDRFAESRTNADGVIGHFSVGRCGKGDFELDASATQLVVVEAKMFSGLSPGTKNASGYHQAARNVACIAEILRRADRSPGELTRLAFQVVAPREQIERGVFGKLVDPENIREAVERRVSAYGALKDSWLSDWFSPTLHALDVALLSWEDVLRIYPSEYHSFYEECLRFNRRT